MKKILVMFISINLVLFFNFSLWGSYGPLIYINQSQADGDDPQPVEDVVETDTYVDPDVSQYNPDVPKPVQENQANNVGHINNLGCIASSDKEFTQTYFNGNIAKTDGLNTKVVFNQQKMPSSDRDSINPFKIKNNQLENFRGIRQLFINLGKGINTDNPGGKTKQETYKRNGEFYGVESPSRYIRSCPEEYSCVKVSSLDGMTPNNIDFHISGGIPGLENNNAKGIGDVYSSEESVEEFLESVKCTQQRECASGVCTPQTKLGLSLNYNIPLIELDKIWLLKEEANPDDPDAEPAFIFSDADTNNIYSKPKYCQPLRTCLRKPTGKNEKLEHNDSYCAPSLKKVGDVCVNGNEFVLDNIDTFPQAKVNMENCKIKWFERKISSSVTDRNDDKTDIQESSGEYCTIPGIKTQKDCEDDVNNGTWNYVSIKYSTFSRLLLGLEWLWSSADLDNVKSKIDVFNTNKNVLLGDRLHKLGEKIKELRTKIALDRIAKLDLAIQESLNNQLSEVNPPDDPDNSPQVSDTDNNLRNIQLKFFDKMKYNSLDEASMWVDIYGESGMDGKTQEHLLDLALAVNPLPVEDEGDSSDESEKYRLTDIQKANNSIRHEDYNKDSDGTGYLSGEDFLAHDLSCSQIDHSTDDGEDDSFRSCDMADDGDYCEYQISDRNCVQDTVYLITNDYFFADKAHKKSEKFNTLKQGEDLSVGSFYINQPMTEEDKHSYGRNRATMNNTRLVDNVHYETSCFYFNKKEQDLLDYEDDSHNWHMTDDCNDASSGGGERVEWALSKTGCEDVEKSDHVLDECIAQQADGMSDPPKKGIYCNEENQESCSINAHTFDKGDYAFRDGYNGWYLDQIDGVTMAFIGHFARVPEYGTLPRRDFKASESYNSGPGVPAYNCSENCPEDLRPKIYGVRQQGGLVNPVIPKSILSEDPFNFAPQAEDGDGQYNIPRIGNWYFDEEDKFKENIKKELGKYFDIFDEKAKACGKNVKINSNILNLEEFLFQERQDNPSLTLQEAKLMISSNYEERINKTLDELTNQIYDLILSLHFSQFSGEHGTFSLVSRVVSDLTPCPEEDPVVDRCRGAENPYAGRPLGKGLEKLNTIIYWMALYKAAEAQMFDDLHTCMAKRYDKVDQALGTMGIIGKSELEQMNKETNGVVAQSSSLSQCLMEDDSGNGGSPNGNPTGPTNTGGPDNSLDDTGFSNTGQNVASNNALAEAEKKKEKEKQTTNTGGLDGDGGSSGSSGGGNLTGGNPDSDNGSVQNQTGSSNSASGSGPGNAAKRAKKLQKKLIATAKKINQKNKELAELFESAGARKPSTINSTGALQSTFASGGQKLASLSSIPSKDKKQSLQKAKAGASSSSFSKRTTSKGGGFSSGRSGRRSRSRKRVSAKQARNNKKVLNYIKKNRGKFMTQDSDSIFGRITKAVIRVGYPIFLETTPTDMDGKKIPTQGRQNAVELTPEQKAARKEMELLKKLNKK